jgi:hypothetical protein
MQDTWLEDYALFRALKKKFGGSYYLEWPEDLVQRKPATLAKARHELADEIGRFRLEQFLLLRQADRLKEYAHAKDVSLIGDLPFFVSPDSSDVGPPQYWLPILYRPPACSPNPRGRNSPGSFPRFRWRLAQTRRRQNGADRGLDTRPRCRVF